MQSRNIWWFSAEDDRTLADFRRRAVLAVETGIPAAAGEAPAHWLECEMAVGDLVLASAGGGHELLVGEVAGAPMRRPGLTAMQSLRSMRWHGRLPETAFDQTLLDAMHDVGTLARLDVAWCTPVETLVAAHSGNDDGEPLRFELDVSPPAVTMPDLIPILYQSPYAERILRDFRWREYLLANPDVAATGESEAHAFAHFFHQGYYERRIFDPKRLDGFDPGFYRERYPELGLADDAQAQIHYCYHGWYEERVPNRDTAWLYDADLHVFQMGKVGSHAIARGLRDAGYDGRAIHLHWATDVVTGYPSNRLPYARLLAHPRTRPVRVLSGVREIVSWTLSSLFQYHGAATMNVRDAVALVEERFWQVSQAGIRWFDHRYFCDLDVYAHPFDPALGCARVRHGGLDLLVYRQEDLSRLSGELAEFLRLPGFAPAADNVGSDKPYADLYRRIQSAFRLPGNLLSSLYDTPYMRHFYSDEERERGFARWRRDS